MLNDINGIVNFVLLSLGLVSSQILFMRGSVSAISTVIMMDVWQATPYTAILLLAGLQAIPTELYDACRGDGGNKFFKLDFWQWRKSKAL